MMADRPLVWDVTATEALLFVAGNDLGLLTGFMLGVLIRNSVGAVVGYFIYTFVPPTVLPCGPPVRRPSRTCAAGSTSATPNNPSSSSTADPPSSSGPQIGVTAVCWLLLPLIGGIALVMKSEVK
jgi:ABC-2 type transport system permease protein